MQDELQFQKNSWRLTLPRKFDKIAQKEFEAKIQQILSGGYIKLSLDLSLVTFVSSAGLGQITMTCLDLKAKGIQVTVDGISQKVQGLLDRHGLSDLLAAAKL